MRERQSVRVLERQSVGASERRSVAHTVQLSTVETDLRRLYERWQDLSEAEAEAIHARNWMNVLNHQNAKKAVIREIALLNEADGLSATLRSMLEQLLALELVNAKALAAKREILAKEQGTLVEAGRKLQQVHRAYGAGPLPAWHSYS